MSAPDPGTGRRLPRIGLSQFAIPLGLAGLAGAWAAAEEELDAFRWVGDVLWAIVAAIWLGFVALYLAQSGGRWPAIASDIRHPVTGPFAGSIPLVAVLLLTHYGPAVPDAAPWLIWAAISASVLIAAGLFARWLTSRVDVDLLHPGYLLPFVAASFIGSIGLSSIHDRGAAGAAFAVGVFFWLVIGTVVVGRLVARPGLIPGLRPTLAVFSVPPAVAGIAWLFLNGGKADPVADGLVGIAVVLFVVQLMLIPVYRGVPISISFWTFAFPVASTTTFLIRWLAASGATAAWPSWVILGAATVAVTAIAVITGASALRSRARPTQRDSTSLASGRARRAG